MLMFSAPGNRAILSMPHYRRDLPPSRSLLGVEQNAPRYSPAPRRLPRPAPGGDFGSADAREIELGTARCGRGGQRQATWTPTAVHIASRS